MEPKWGLRVPQRHCLKDSLTIEKNAKPSKFCLKRKVQFQIIEFWGLGVVVHKILNFRFANWVYLKWKW